MAEWVDAFNNRPPLFQEVTCHTSKGRTITAWMDIYTDAMEEDFEDWESCENIELDEFITEWLKY